jgi:hypothetical protein
VLWKKNQQIRWWIRDILQIAGHRLLLFNLIFLCAITNEARAPIRSYAKAAPTEVSSILEERIRGVSGEANLNETGRVLSIGYV